MTLFDWRILHGNFENMSCKLGMDGMKSASLTYHDVGGGVVRDDIDVVDRLVGGIMERKNELGWSNYWERSGHRMDRPNS